MVPLDVLVRQLRPPVAERTSKVLLIAAIIIGMFAQLVVCAVPDEATISMIGNAPAFTLQGSATGDPCNSDSSNCNGIFDCAVAGIISLPASGHVLSVHSIVERPVEATTLHSRSIKPDLSPPIVSV